jgi:type II secretory pathway pseudopilin PulG
LLVVIAIIAILASLLLLTLSKARTSAQSIRCLNNLKQLQLGWQIYADEHSDQLVPHWVIMPSWPMDYRDNYSTTNSWVSGSAMLTDSTDGIRRGALWPYTQNTSPYRCPLDRSLWRYGARRASTPHG